MDTTLLIGVTVVVIIKRFYPSLKSRQADNMLMCPINEFSMLGKYVNSHIVLSTNSLISRRSHGLFESPY